MTELTAQPGEELAKVALIGAERMVGGTALVCQVDEPAFRRAARIVFERQLAVVANSLERRHGGLIQAKRARLRQHPRATVKPL
jgi:hypothetical protein